MKKLDIAKDYYSILEIAPTASQEEIKHAYRKQAMKWHPDRNLGIPEAANIFKTVSEAYSILSDEESRSCYDSSRPRDFSIGKRLDGIMRAFQDLNNECMKGMQEAFGKYEETLKKNGTYDKHGILKWYDDFMKGKKVDTKA